jgi:hypothetical protein
LLLGYVLLANAGVDDDRPSGQEASASAPAGSRES